MKIYTQISIAGIIAMGVACAGTGQVEQKQRFTISPPIPNVNVPLEKYVISANRDTVLYMPTGTEVHVPAGSIVDADGKSIDKAEISFREFHSISDVIVSGIPMVVREGDSLKHFETAGMFEISASWEGKSLKVNAQKPLQVELASGDSTQFDAYFYDSTSSTVWNKMGANAVHKNERRERTLDSLLELLPVKPQLYSSEKDLVIDLSIESLQNAESNEALWKYVGAKSKEEVAVIMKGQWNSVSVARHGAVYLVSLSGTSLSGEKTAKLELQPVYTASNIADAEKKYNQQMANLTAVLTQTQNLSSTDQMLRSFQVAEFGIYNSDRCAIETNNLITFSPRFTLPDKQVVSGGDMFIVEGKNAVIAITATASIKFDAGKPSAFIVVLNDNKVGYITASNLAALNIKQNEERIVPLQISKGAITSSADIALLLN